MPGINDVEIVLYLHENWENLTQANKVDLLRKLRLITNIRTSNMHLLDSHGKLRKYDSPEQSMYYLFATRLLFFFFFLVIVTKLCHLFQYLGNSLS